MNATVPLTGTSPRARRIQTTTRHTHARVEYSCRRHVRARTQRNGATGGGRRAITYIRRIGCNYIAAMLARETCERARTSADAQTRVGVSPDRARILFPRSREYRGENAEIRGSCNKRIMWEYSRGDDRYEETLGECRVISFENVDDAYNEKPTAPPTLPPRAAANRIRIDCEMKSY